MNSIVESVIAVTVTYNDVDFLLREIEYLEKEKQISIQFFTKSIDKFSKMLYYGKNWEVILYFKINRLFFYYLYF